MIRIKKKSDVASGQHMVPADTSSWENSSSDSLKGGLSEGKDFKVKKSQIFKGLKTEFEHTDDPLKALEIAFDHLYENSNYYTALARAEKSSKKKIKKKATGLLSLHMPTDSSDHNQDDHRYKSNIIVNHTGKTHLPVAEKDSINFFGGFDDIELEGANPPTNLSKIKIKRVMS